MDLTGDLATNWESFKDNWENYVIATELEKKVAKLISIMGQECYKIYKNLALSDAERKSSSTIIEKLTAEFESKRNIIYERYLYNSTIQETDESFDRFLNRLREHISHCKYAALEEMLRDRIVIGINNNNTRERLLRKKDLDLDKAIHLCRTSETAAIQLHSMEPTDTVHYARSRVGKPKSYSGQRA